MRRPTACLLASLMCLAPAPPFAGQPAKAAELTAWDNLRRDESLPKPLRDMADRKYREAERKLIDDAWSDFGEMTLLRFLGGPRPSAEADAPGPNGPFGFSRMLANFDATREPGEPSQSGVMNKTLWNWVTAADTRKVVIHTFASRIDTALAVYEGKDRFLRLKRIAFDDDTPTPGVGDTQSVVQFVAKKGEPYSIQIGSKTGATDDVSVTTRVFPPEGGLSIFLATAGGARLYDHPYFVEFNPQGFPPTFVLHNSTKKPMEVVSSSDLGGGVKAPAPVTLAAGATRTVSFAFTDAFDTSPGRTVSGSFVFTGRRGGKVVGAASHPALIASPLFPAQPDALRVEVDAPIRATMIGDVARYLVRLTNRSSKRVTDCYARTDVFEQLSVSWRQFDAKRKRFVGGIDELFSLDPGETKAMGVQLETHAIYDGDPTTVSPVKIGCGSTGPAALDLSNQISVTSRTTGAPADMVVEAFEPGDVLDLPGSGKGAFRVRGGNAGTAARLVARPVYAGWFEDAPDTRFGVSVCETNKKGDCLDKPKPQLTFDAEPEKLKWFKVFVTAPDSDPGFDPGKRRVFLRFEQDIGFGFSGSQIVGAASVAVKR